MNWSTTCIALDWSSPQRSIQLCRRGRSGDPVQSTETTTVKATVDHSHDSPGTWSWLVAYTR